jgi:hypothetical protein
VVTLALVTTLMAWSLWTTVRAGSVAGTIIFGVALALLAGMLVWIIALGLQRGRDPTRSGSSGDESA